MEWIKSTGYLVENSHKNVTKLPSKAEIPEIKSFNCIYPDFFFIQNFISPGEFPCAQEVGSKVPKSGRLPTKLGQLEHMLLNSLQKSI